MTVGELIEKLKAFDPTIEVYTNGYEGGYDDLCKIEPVEVCKGFYVDDESWYYGDHEEFNVVRKSPADPFSYDIVKGIVISR